MVRCQCRIIEPSDDVAVKGEYFESNVGRVLGTGCRTCHKAMMKASGLDLSSASGFWTGGTGGALIAKDQLEASRFLKVIGYEESLKMPPTGKLKPEQI